MSDDRNGHPRPEGARTATVEEIAAELSGAPDRFVVTSHHNPDGDALGSMLGLGRAMIAHGHDVVYAHRDEHPVPPELAFLMADGEVILPDLPPDAADRILVAVDSATAMRLWPDRAPHTGVRRVINIDHHHDNTCFGHLNLVDGSASSSAEIVVHVLEAAGWMITREMAVPLYAGLITDTGRFCYANTTGESHRVASVLLAAGVDPEELGRRLYEELPIDRLRLLGRAMGTADLRCEGQLMVASLGPADFSASGGADTEGIVEAMRSVEGVRVAALARSVGTSSWRVSVRSDTDDVDVSAIARAEGGGGHRRAAGFTTKRPPDDLFAWMEGQVADQLAS